MSSPQFAKAYESHRAAVESIAKIQAAVQEIWSHGPLLEGFTDHGPAHSDRVAQRVDEILGGESLSADEAYVIHAACWLHDIGMQDYGLLEDRDHSRRATAPLNPSERRLIREMHAARGQDILVEPTLRCVRLRGRDGAVRVEVMDGYWRHVGVVVGAHSTNGFAALGDIVDQGPGEARDFRYKLLGALLLIADECDLSYARAHGVEQYGIERIDSESLLHMLKHRYVQRSTICRSSSDVNGRQLEIVYNWPDSQDVEAVACRLWIRGKLLRQMRAADPVMRKHLGVHWDADRPVHESSASPIPVERIPDRITPLLLSERARSQLADVQRELQELWDALLSGSPIVLVEPSGLGEDGASDVASVLAGRLVSRAIAEHGHEPPVVTLDGAHPEYGQAGTDPMELVRLVSGHGVAEASGDGEADEAASEWYRRQRWLQALRHGVEGGERKIVVLRQADRLPQATIALVREGLFDIAAGSGGRLALIATVHDPTVVLGTPPHPLARRCDLPRIGRDDLVEFLEAWTLQSASSLHAWINDKLRDRDVLTQREALETAVSLAASRFEVPA